MNEIEARSNLGSILGFDIAKVMRYAQNYPEDFRGLKGYLTHGLNFIPSNMAKYEEMIDIYKSLSKLNQSTFLKCNNGLRKSEDVLNSERTSSKLPPAFDATLIASHSKYDIDNLLSMSDNPGTCCHKFIDHVKVLFRKSMTMVPQEDIITLTNGTTTRIVNNGININDILSICFSDPEVVKLFPKTIKFFHITNFDYETIEFDDNMTGGDRMLIADKEYKTREVYRMTSTVQVISKSIHRVLDRVAKKLYGNYTYDHTGFLKKTIDMGRHQEGNLISTDMSKYSDTLDRRLIMGILLKIGIPQEVVDELDILYSMPVKDKHTSRIFRETKATYQGQYGDFPMITIANLYLQCYVRDTLGFHNYEDMKTDNAAVGDDTCFYFPTGDPDYQLSVIIRTYAMAGVNINRLKTHCLINGDGSIDFVKRVVDNSGLVPYWIPNLLTDMERSDEGVREVFRHYEESHDELECLQVLEHVCGWSMLESRRIMSLHRINGGLREDAINSDDLHLYMARAISMDYSSRLTDNGSKRWLYAFRDYLRDNGMSLIDTPLLAYYSGFSDLEDGDSVSVTMEDMEEDILKNICNMNRIGFRSDTLDVSHWLGMSWDDIKDEDILNDYMVSFRFKETTLDSRKCYDKVLTLPLSDIDILKLYGESIARLDDYIISSNRLEAYHLITNKLKCKVRVESYFGYDYVYTYIKDRKVRLYSVTSGSYYSLPSDSELQEMGLSIKEINLLRSIMPSRDKCYDFWKPVM